MIPRLRFYDQSAKLDYQTIQQPLSSDISGQISESKIINYQKGHLVLQQSDLQLIQIKSDLFESISIFGEQENRKSLFKSQIIKCFDLFVQKKNIYNQNIIKNIIDQDNLNYKGVVDRFEKKEENKEKNRDKYQLLKPTHRRFQSVSMYLDNLRKNTQKQGFDNEKQDMNEEDSKKNFQFYRDQYEFHNENSNL